MEPLLLNRIDVWIMIKNILINIFIQLKLVNHLLVLLSFEHVGRPKPGTKTSGFRPIPTDTSLKKYL